jgi:hypothetical protein
MQMALSPGVRSSYFRDKITFFCVRTGHMSLLMITLNKKGVGYKYLYDGELYFQKNHVHLLKEEPEYIKEQYHAIANVSFYKSNILREKMTHNLVLSRCHFNRLLKRYLDEGITGLRKKSTRPHQYPNHTKP